MKVNSPVTRLPVAKIATEAIIYVAVMKGKNVIKKNLNLYRLPNGISGQKDSRNKCDK